MKRCSRCGQTKELSEFSRDAQKADGYYSACKQCKKQEWVEKHGVRSNQKEIAYTVSANGCWECTSHFCDTSGYPCAMRNGKKQHISRIVYEETHGPIPAGIVVRHKCDNPSCINPDHIELGTQYDNVHDMINRKRKKPVAGSLNPRAKLSQEDVIEILKSYKNGKRQVDIALSYGVSRSCVFSIVRNRTWKSLKKGARF